MLNTEYFLVYSNNIVGNKNVVTYYYYCCKFKTRFWGLSKFDVNSYTSNANMAWNEGVGFSSEGRGDSKHCCTYYGTGVGRYLLLWQQTSDRWGPTHVSASQYTASARHRWLEAYNDKTLSHRHRYRIYIFLNTFVMFTYSDIFHATNRRLRHIESE